MRERRSFSSPPDSILQEKENKERKGKESKARIGGVSKRDLGVP
jgi:hypothetical protein